MNYFYDQRKFGLNRAKTKTATTNTAKPRRLREKEILTGSHLVCHEELQIECRLHSLFQELFPRVDAKNIRGSHMPSVFRVTNLKNNH